MMTLKRVAILSDGAFGVLLWHGVPFAVTCERTEVGQRAAQQTVLPQGVFTCKRRPFFRGGYDTWIISNEVIPESRLILFHKGNFETDSQACILVGEKFEPLNGRLAIQQSGDGFANLMALTAQEDQFSLAILNC